MRVRGFSQALSDEGFDGMVHAAGGKLLDLNVIGSGCAYHQQ